MRGPKVLMSTPDLRRKRCPIGGYALPVRLDALCRAGQMYVLRVCGAVKRSAWWISPAITSS